MSNSVRIDLYERKDLRTGAVDYTIDICDDNDSATLVFLSKKDVPDNDMELLEYIIRAKHAHDIHGTSCDAVVEILDFVYDHKHPIRIGDKRYEWSEIEQVMKYDFRDIISCPKCGWESFSDDDYDHPCLRGGCDGTMSEFRNESYEK